MDERRLESSFSLMKTFQDEQKKKKNVNEK